MNIRTQYYLGAGLSVAIVLVIGAMLVAASQRLDRAVERSSFATGIAAGMGELRFVTIEYMLHHHERPRVQWQQRHEGLTRLLATDTFEGSDLQKILEELRQRHEEMQDAFTQLTRHYASGGKDGSGPADPALMRDQESRLVGQLLTTSQEILTMSLRLLRRSESEITAMQRRMSLLLALTGASMLLVVLANVVLANRSILNPIRRLQHAIAIIGSGDLSQRSGITSANEIGALSQAFDRMTERLQEARATLEAEQRRAGRQEATREGEERYRGILESVMEGIITVDERQRIVVFNRGAERMFRWPAANILGQPLGVLLPERFRDRHDEYLRHFAATGATGRTMGQYQLIYGLRQDGVEFPVEASISQSGQSPNKLLTVILRDITERLRAEEALRRHSAQLRDLSRRLVETEESERRRLARELHDRIGQNISTLNLNLQMLRGELPAEVQTQAKGRLDDCESLLHYTGQLVRDIMNDLRPPGLDELGLLTALHEYARYVTKRSRVPVTVKGIEPTPRLPLAIETTLFRVAQEALGNAVKHAQASEVVVTLEADNGGVTLTVADNGRGFDSSAPLPLGHLGIIGMRERAEAVGGRLQVESAPRAGTRVIVAAPRAAPAHPA